MNNDLKYYRFCKLACHVCVFFTAALLIVGILTPSVFRELAAYKYYFIGSSMIFLALFVCFDHYETSFEEKLPMKIENMDYNLKCYRFCKSACHVCFIFTAFLLLTGVLIPNPLNTLIAYKYYFIGSSIFFLILSLCFDHYETSFKRKIDEVVPGC